MTTHSTTRPSNALRIMIDENTGGEIRQLTNLPQGANLSYFRFTRHLPNGKMLAYGKHATGNILVLDPESGHVEYLPYFFQVLRVDERSGLVWFFKNGGDANEQSLQRELWSINLSNGNSQPQKVAVIPDTVPGGIHDITCDGQLLILLESEQDVTRHPVPTTKDVRSVWHYLNRPRRGAIWIYDIVNKTARKIHQTQDVCPAHIDASPSDPRLLRFCLDMYDAYGQRVWTIRTDGTDLKKIRPQERGQLVTHEFWWSDPNHIGYTYLDRRGETTIHELPWSEYAKSPTQLGLADLSGREIYLSDPLNSYHTHLYVSRDGRFVSGEGTHDHSFVYAAKFSINQTRLDMQPLATIHTPYVPFRGQGVDCDFSADGKWLIYADKINGSPVHQLFAVAVDL